MDKEPIIICNKLYLMKFLLDTLMLGLRLADGVGIEMLAEKFGGENTEKIQKTLKPFIEKGWVYIVEGRIKLSDPEGFLFSNMVLSVLFKEFGL